MMTWDSGGAIILSTVIGVVLVWIGGLVTKHFDNSHEVASSADQSVDKLEKEFLRYQAHVAEHYVKTTAFESMKRDMFGVIARLEEKLDRLLLKGGGHE